MKSCSVFDCVNRSETSPDLTFYTLPRNELRRRIWTVRMKRDNLFDEDRNDVYVCSVHFPSTINAWTVGSISFTDADPMLNLPAQKPKSDADPSLNAIENTTSQVTGPKSTVTQEGAVLITRIYYYLHQEYEQLKTGSCCGCDLNPLSNILKRTAEATGVTEDTVLEILEEAEQVNHASATRTRKRRISELQTQSEDLSSVAKIGKEERIDACVQEKCDDQGEQNGQRDNSKKASDYVMVDPGDASNSAVQNDAVMTDSGGRQQLSNRLYLEVQPLELRGAKREEDDYKLILKFEADEEVITATPDTSHIKVKSEPPDDETQYNTSNDNLCRGLLTRGGRNAGRVRTLRTISVGNGNAAIVESSRGYRGRGGCGKASRGRRRGFQANEAHGRGGGVLSRPLAQDDINIGMIGELPLESPLETSPHAKRRRTLAQDRDLFEVEHPEYDQPSTSPAAHVECAVTTTARAARTTQTFRRPLGDNEICGLLNYGSEEEEESNPASDEECEAQVSIPHRIRALLETAEDTPQEAEAAGRIEAVESAHTGDGMMRGPTSLFHFEWQNFPASPISPHLRREKFVGRCGSMIGPISSPYEAFLLIWDRPIMEHIALQTNLYAQEYAEQLLGRGEIGPSSRITLWRDTNVDELYVYFALLMAMGIVVNSKLEEYWCTDRNIFSTPGYSTNMSLKRFQLLSKCLHFNNNRNVSSNTLTRSQAKIYKVAPIVDHLNIKFSSLYGLGQNIALDESLTQWKGWLDIKQFIPNKAAAVDIKTYEVCDSRTGYLWRFECHMGGQIEIQQEVISGSIPNLVLRLLRGLENRGHTVWMDNYYNSPALARVLKSLGYDCVGTLRTNRQFVPAQITDLKKADMTMGQVCGCTSGDVDLMVWRDQKRVALLSTYHGISVSENKPIAIKDYNVCMGGVDKKDQTLSAYPLERKRTQVWYKKFFRRLLNVSVLNAYILYKHTHDISHRKFREDLVTEILQKHLQSRPDIAIATVRGVPKFSAEVISHLPAELPVLPGQTGKQRRQCVVCKTKRTHYVCRACSVALCVNFSDTSSCYIRYHT